MGFNPVAAFLDKAFSVGGLKPKIAVAIKGDHEAIAALRKLPDEVAMRVMRLAMKKSLVPGYENATLAAWSIRDQAARKHGMHLSESVTQLVKGYKQSDVVYGMVGYTAPHGWLVEHGHRIVTGGSVTRINQLRSDYGKAPYVKDSEGKIDNSKTGKGTAHGFVPGHPFFDKAMRRAMNEMQTIFIDEVTRGTARAIKGIAKKAGAA